MLNYNLKKVLATLLTMAALFAGQQAFAARKAVTYTITSIELNSSTNNYDIVFTRSGDTPFDASAPTTYTTSVAKTSIGQSPGYPGQFHIDLADGFEILASWNSGSNVSFSNNCIQSGISEKPITYAVSNYNGGYYVTRIVMQGMEYTWDNTTYDFIRPFAHNTSTVRPFGSLTITYYDAIPEDIGSIQYNRLLEAYEINCAQHLQDLAEYVNGEYGTNYSVYPHYTYVVKEPHNCSGLTFRQTADIDFEPTSAWDDYNSDEHNLFAIGCIKQGWHNNIQATYNNYFGGTYDGQGHTISGIRIHGNGADATDGYMGLFGYVKEGTVQNVTIANARIAGYNSTGGIVGLNTIGSTVSNCHAAHDVAIYAANSSISSVGGIVGDNLYSSNVTGCTSAAVITAIGMTDCQYFGGIVGKNGSGCTVSNCTAAGVIVPSYSIVPRTGAIVGENEGTLTGNTYHSCLMGTAHAFNIGTGVGNVAGTTLDNTKLFLYDDRDNTDLINAYAKVTTAYSGTAPSVSNLTVTLKGRTLYKDGTWNTLCLPFNPSLVGYYAGADIMEMDNSANGGTAFDATTGTLTINFKTVSTITKGQPYIIKWTSGNDIVDPTFSNVDGSRMTASTTIVKSSDNYISLRGTYGPVTPTDGKLLDAHNADNRGFHCYITLASPTAPEGYAFGGWYTDNTLTTPVTTLPFGTDGAFSLYAKFNPALTVTGYGTGNDKWTFIASPVTGSIAPTAVENIFSATQYDLYRLNPSNTMWENYKPHTGNAAPGFSLENGRGYLYATKETKTLAFTGAFNTGSSKVVDLEQGWNLVGNPFTVDAYVNRPFYKMNTDGTGIVAVENYDNYTTAQTIPACTGIVVKANTSGESVTFSTTAPSLAAPNNGNLQITLTQANTRGNALLDNAIVSFNEGSQLGKFYFGEQNGNIYIPQGGEEYAIVCSDRQGEMPLCFKARENGSYTITVNPEGVTFDYLHLIDNMTGANIDLLATPSYTFTARNDDYASRFKLVFNTLGGGSENEDFAFISNGNLIVNGEGTLQVIDIIGRTLFTKELSTFNSSLSTLNFTPGIYVLQLINGEQVRTQKIAVE